jgi:hypothetical protein
MTDFFHSLENQFMEYVMNHVSYGKVKLSRISEPGENQIIEHTNTKMSRYATEVSHVKIR